MPTNVKTKVKWNILYRNEKGDFTTKNKDVTLKGLRRIIYVMNGRFISAIPLHIIDYERLGRYSQISNLTEHDMIIIAREQSNWRG